MGKLDNKVAIVTGAARGIGAATARRFIAEGAQVLLTDMLEELGRETAASLGEAAHFISHDVSDESQWQQVTGQCMQLFGGVDILVNNAGIGGGHFKTLADIEPAMMRKMFEVNVFGTVLGMQSVIPLMAERGAGSIVNISSTAAILGMNATAIYGATKWAVLGLSKVAALELGHRGIRVNTIHPGGTNTAMSNQMGVSGEEYDKMLGHTALQRGCKPEEIANGILYFACEDSAYCTGSELLIDGGQGAGLYMRALPGAPPRNK